MQVLITLLLPIAKYLIVKAIENNSKKDDLRIDFDLFYKKLAGQNKDLGSESIDFDSL